MKGMLPLLVLQVLSHGPNYGYQILADLRRLSNGVLEYNEGALYPVLYQLERDEYVDSYTEGDGRSIATLLSTNDQRAGTAGQSP